ncbi:MAG TPA: DUF58 domain-containing protein [Bdellovibrionales bacterium]|nr:DUF58 domain-containing protein [Bdellovibrionales bacterium]
MKIYIIPTRFGLMAAASLAVMLTAGIIYTNNSIFLITFTAASLLLALMIETHRNLKALEFVRAEISSGFAGSLTELRVLLRNNSKRRISNIEISPNSDIAQKFSIGGGDQGLCVAHLEVKARGQHTLRRIRIGTTAPVGLFWAWGYIQLNQKYVGYPKPAGPAPVPDPVQSNDRGQSRSAGEGDDFSGHKTFEAGHSWRRIDWKAVSRGRPWMTKNFQGAHPESLYFDFSKLQGETESRLSQLSLWVKQAHAQNQTFALKLGPKSIPFGSGSAHAIKCLEELGVYEHESQAS